MPTDITRLRNFENYVGPLHALGLDTLEQLLAVAQIAGRELGALLHVDVDRLLEPVIGQADQLTSEEETELADLSCAFGARIDQIVPTPDIAASLVMTPAATSAYVNLIPSMPPIRNQYQRGTCVAFAVVAVLEHWLRLQTGEHGQDMSPQFLYWDCKHNDGAVTQPGTWIRVGAPLVQRDGVCPESVWPYNPNPIPGNEPQDPVPPGAQRNALPFRVPAATALPPTSVSDFKAELAMNRCVAFSIPFYNSWYLSSQVRLTGDITNPIPGEVRSGGHAMCMVGYLDLPDRPELGGGRFILRNSWGAGWGSHSPYGAGYGTIPYIYISRLGVEAYTLG